MPEKYFVLHKRDMEFEIRKKYESKMLYDKLSTFDDIEKAKECAFQNLPAILAEYLPASGECDSYIVAAEFRGKYTSSSYDGSSDWLTTYDALSCSKEGIESAIEEFAAEKRFKKIHLGLELKLY